MEEVKYDSFHQDLRKLCEADSVSVTGVGAHHTPHSFRIGAISTQANAGVNPAFIQQSARHKQLASTLRYMRPDMQTALNTNDLLCDNKGGWDKLLSAGSNSLNPFLLPEQVDKKVFSETEVRPSVIQPSVSPSSGLINKTLYTGKGRKRKTVSQTEVNPPAKVGTSQGYNLARSKIEALPGTSLIPLGFPQ